MGQLENKVVLITGAGSGIGRASALACAHDGAIVIVSDVSEEGGTGTVDLRTHPEARPNSSGRT